MKRLQNLYWKLRDCRKILSGGKYFIISKPNEEMNTFNHFGFTYDEIAHYGRFMSDYYQAGADIERELEDIL